MFLLAYISLVMSLMRALDLVVLVRWPSLLRAYLSTWKSAYQKSPFQERSFEKIATARRRGRSQIEFTYGETPVITARRMLRHAGVDEDSEVLDLGMGRGRVLIAAATLGARARGADLLAAHVEMTRDALARVDIEVECEDAARVDLAGATHIFVAWTCFTSRSREEVARHLSSASPGTTVLTLDHALRNEDYEDLGGRAVFCSWGRATVYRARRRA